MSESVCNVIQQTYLYKLLMVPMLMRIDKAQCHYLSYEHVMAKDVPTLWLRTPDAEQMNQMHARSCYDPSVHWDRLLCGLVSVVSSELSMRMTEQHPYPPQFLVLECQHPCALGEQLHLDHGQRVCGGEVSLGSPPGRVAMILIRAIHLVVVSVQGSKSQYWLTGVCPSGRMMLNVCDFVGRAYRFCLWHLVICASP